jgi:hypothetical protein
MNKIAMLIWFLAVTTATAQTCQNPGARLEQLRTNNLNKDSIYQWVKSDLEFAGLKKGDTVADVGSYDGYYPLIYSIFSDSVAFYLNDISPEGFIYFDSIQTTCAEKKGRRLTNSFKIVMGNDSCTNLPTHMFNKVIVKDALHHFKLMDKMLVDIKRIMKSETKAKLILFEPIKEQTESENLCRGALYREALLKLMVGNGFKLLRELPIKNKGSWFEFDLSEYEVKHWA